MAHHALASSYSGAATSQCFAEGYFENLPKGIDADSSRDGAGRPDFQEAVPPGVPPRVEYQLTDMGASVIEPLKTLCLWAEAHAEQRDRARREFDARKKGSS
jgi:hypothetical protein